jgi:hypothetical protein
VHFDGWNTLEGRHLVLAYASVFVIQGGYLIWIASQWLRVSRAPRTNTNAGELDPGKSTRLV